MKTNKLRDIFTQLIHHRKIYQYLFLLISSIASGFISYLIVLGMITSKLISDNPTASRQTEIAIIVFGGLIGFLIFWLCIICSGGVLIGLI